MRDLLNDFALFWRLDDRAVQDRVIVFVAALAVIVVAVS
jgi:hypothetical protein